MKKGGKFFISSAIVNLAWYLSLSPQGALSEIGLRLCLNNLEKSLMPPELRSSEYPVKDEHLKDISRLDLSKAVDVILTQYS